MNEILMGLALVGALSVLASAAVIGLIARLEWKRARLVRESHFLHPSMKSSVTNSAANILHLPSNLGQV